MCGIPDIASSLDSVTCIIYLLNRTNRTTPIGPTEPTQSLWQANRVHYCIK